MNMKAQTSALGVGTMVQSNFAIIGFAKRIDHQPTNTCYFSNVVNTGEYGRHVKIPIYIDEKNRAMSCTDLVPVLSLVVQKHNVCVVWHWYDQASQAYT